MSLQLQYLHLGTAFSTSKSYLAVSSYPIIFPEIAQPPAVPRVCGAVLEVAADKIRIPTTMGDTLRSN